MLIGAAGKWQPLIILGALFLHRLNLRFCSELEFTAEKCYDETTGFRKGL